MKERVDTLDNTCSSWWKINLAAPKNHLHANICHRKREAKAMEARITKSIDKTFLMSKKINFYYQKWMNYYKEINPYKGDQNPKKETNLGCMIILIK